jgi:hypothetical protein
LGSLAVKFQDMVAQMRGGSREVGEVTGVVSSSPLEESDQDG